MKLKYKVNSYVHETRQKILGQIYVCNYLFLCITIFSLLVLSFYTWLHPFSYLPCLPLTRVYFRALGTPCSRLNEFPYIFEHTVLSTVHASLWVTFGFPPIRLLPPLDAISHCFSCFPIAHRVRRHWHILFHNYFPTFSPLLLSTPHLLWNKTQAIHLCSPFPTCLIIIYETSGYSLLSLIISVPQSFSLLPWTSTTTYKLSNSLNLQFLGLT